MDRIIETATLISEKFILCEIGHACNELDKLSQLLLQRADIVKKPQVLPILEELVKAQEKKNYIYIADLLRYRLIPALESS